MGGREPAQRSVGTEGQTSQSRRVGRKEQPTKRAPPPDGAENREDWAPEGLAKDEVRQAVACADAAHKASSMRVREPPACAPGVLHEAKPAELVSVRGRSERREEVLEIRCHERAANGERSPQGESAQQLAREDLRGAKRLKGAAERGALEALGAQSGENIHVGDDRGGESGPVPADGGEPFGWASAAASERSEWPKVT